MFYDTKFNSFNLGDSNILFTFSIFFKTLISIRAKEYPAGFKNSLMQVNKSK